MLVNFTCGLLQFKVKRARHPYGPVFSLEWLLFLGKVCLLPFFCMFVLFSLRTERMYFMILIIQGSNFVQYLYSKIIYHSDTAMDIAGWMPANYFSRIMLDWGYFEIIFLLTILARSTLLCKYSFQHHDSLSRSIKLWKSELKCATKVC